MGLSTGGSVMRSHPLMPGTQFGHTFTTSTGTFTEVPDALLQKTTVRLNVEIMGTLSSLAGPETNTKTVLEETFNVQRRRSGEPVRVDRAFRQHHNHPRSLMPGFGEVTRGARSGHPAVPCHEPARGCAGPSRSTWPRRSGSGCGPT